MRTTILLLSVLLTLQCSAINNDSIAIEQLNERFVFIEQQNEKMTKELKKIRKSVDKLESKIKSQSKYYQQEIDSLENVIITLEATSVDVTNKLDKNIKETQSQAQTNRQELIQSIKSKTIIGCIVLFLMIFFVFLLFLTLRKRITSSVNSIDTIRETQKKIEEAQKKLQEETFKLDEKLVGILEKQLELQSGNSIGKEEIDHSLAKKVADEIARIELNLSRMDTSVKGYKQLSKAVERIKNNFLAQGYEIVDMLGKNYNGGMRVIANFVMDESLKEGEQIITGITKPQINYKGTMIQAAEITVSQNI